jgi:hypothetical protein
MKESQTTIRENNNYPTPPTTIPQTHDSIKEKWQTWYKT